MGIEGAIKEIAEVESYGIGIGAIVVSLDTGRTLLGKRKGFNGPETWGPPGGKYSQEDQDFVACALRELYEETGIIDYEGLYHTDAIIKTDLGHYQVGLKYVTNYVIIAIVAELDVNPPLEPEATERWDWFEWNNLPAEIFDPFKDFLQSDYPFSEQLQTFIDSLKPQV